MLTPDFVRSVREMDELEGVVEPLPEEDDGQEEDEDEPSAKRQRMLEPTPADNTVPTSVSGLLSNNALEGLKYVAAMKQKQKSTPAPAPASNAVGLGGLADYGSDSE